MPVRPLLRHTVPAGESSAPALPAGLNLVDWGQIRGEYERHRHGMFADAQGGYQSRSHYHGWLARFDGKGFTVKPDREEWRWGLEFERWGRLGEDISASRVERMDNKVNRLEYRRQGITEWFENGPEGLEHGFTIPERPRGAGGELLLQLRQRGDLVAELDSGGRGVSYKTAQGGPALRYRKLVVSDATGRTLPARMVAEGLFLRILVDDRRAVYPVTVDPITQQAYLKASNTGAGDSFGSIGAVGISGDTVVVGAPGEDSNATGVSGTQSDNSAADSGAAYVFVRSGSTWVQQAYLKAARTVPGDRFGVTVAISGDTVVVGTFGGDTNANGGNGTSSDNSASTAGGACVYVRIGTTWGQQAYLKGGTNKIIWSYTGGFEHYGLSVAISGNTAVVGANGDPISTGTIGTPNGNSVVTGGAAYVFVRNGETWGQQAYLTASNPGENDHFGAAVAISGNTVVVGAFGEDSGATGVNGTESDNSVFDAGAAYVFVRSGSDWSQQAYLKASTVGPTYRFGFLGAVAISADTVVVGAFKETSNATGVNGTPSNYTTFAAGAAYIFVRNGTTWSQQAYLKASNTRVSMQFGVAVGVSGNTVVVGANGEQSNVTGVNGPQDNNTLYAAGAAYVFQRTGTTWRQEAYIKASNTGEADDFASAVAISGNTVLVGASGEDSNATGMNGTQSDNSAMNSGA
ncbi:MAG: FG-GAP repeat protein, partial [Acidobacteriaceae bacterium]|nr:FG-GAP repeat protein [Acidobacteriaceae bacterium]